MFKVERKAEITKDGAIVHKRLVTPLFYVNLKPAEFELECGYFKYIFTFASLFIPISIPIAYKCDKRFATHEGSRWIYGKSSAKDYRFLAESHPKKISKINSLAVQLLQ